MRTTSAPSSRKCSATAQATRPARTRSIGGSSPVATTTTERASPSSPSEHSTNSRTSRPRSPTRPMTHTSAAEWRAMHARSVDLPTPGPEKMPMR